MAQYSQNSNEGPASRRRPPPKIPKVPKLLLKDQRNRDDYIPQVVSIGPYHHGSPELQLAESIKPMALEMVLSGDKEREDYYHKKIRDKIIDIRNCYEEDPTNLYSDDELARMMLLDACFIMIRIQMTCDNEMFSDVAYTLGLLNMACVTRDMFLVENQIPLWVVKLLLNLTHEEDQIKELLNRYITRSFFGEFRSKKNPPTKRLKELHLLAASHSLVVCDFTNQAKKTCPGFIKCKFLCGCKAKEKTDLESSVSSQGKSRFRSRMNDLTAKACRKIFKNRDVVDHAEEDIKEYLHSFRSVTNLKANGIHFRPSQTLSLRDVRFESNCIYATLQLPILFVSIRTKVFFLNMIAYELSPNKFSEGVVTSYINLMKSLIVKPEDVKELREKKILFCSTANDEQILRMFHDINTYGIQCLIFQDVKNEIQVHYNSKTKTWIAEFLHTHFSSPWSFTTLFAATCILVLTILQTIYTMKSYFES